MSNGLIASVESVLVAIDKVLVFGAVLCLCAIGVITTFDVVMRYVFHSPLEFAFDLTSMYLFPASVLLILASVHRHNENIDIDLFARKMSLRNWRISSAIGGFAAVVIFAVITVLYTKKAIEAWQAGEYTFGAISWPVWPAIALAAVGFGFLSLSVLNKCLQHLAGTSVRQSAQTEERELS